MFPLLLPLVALGFTRHLHFMLRPELMVLPVGMSSLPVIPVPRIAIVADLFVGVLAQLPGKSSVAGYYPGSTVIGRLIPDVIIETVITVADKKDVLGDADSHMKAQFGRLDKEWWLLVNDRRLMVDWRRRDRYDGCWTGADIDPDVKINVGGKGMGYGKYGGKRQAKQNPFHMTVPSLVESQHPV